jgi:hypothetical protein
VLFCRSICLTAEHITSSNHHLFEFEHEYTLKPKNMILLISRNATPMIQTVYKHQKFNPTNKLFHVGLNIFNNSDKVIKIKKNLRLNVLLRQPHVNYSLHITTYKDICKAETENTAFCTSFNQFYKYK